jgi:hypothetical protein
MAGATVRQLEVDTGTIGIERRAMAGGRWSWTWSCATSQGTSSGPAIRPAAWIHVTALDGQGRTVFESGRMGETGLIEGNDSDGAANTFEPHYERLTSADQVQIYESIIGTPAGAPTTGLLLATQYLEDNRVLPRGFEETAGEETAVLGGVADEQDFIGGEDRVSYRVQAWAQNLAPYQTPEPQRFVRYYNAPASVSSVVVARASSPVRH